MLFTGLMRYYPNEHGVRRFVERVLPQIVRRVPHATLWIVGADPPAAVRALASRHVVLTGRVPDVRPYYSRAQIAIVPLWIGGGTRVKVLEAMAMGVPVVSTALGCEGLDVRDGRTALIADSDEALADAAVRALTRPALRRALVADASALAEEYDWRRVALALEVAFRVARRRRPCSSIAGISPELPPVDFTNWTPGSARTAPATRSPSSAS
jgi:polysaccharide biosynthesis protein PslH